MQRLAFGFAMGLLIGSMGTVLAVRRGLLLPPTHQLTRISQDWVQRDANTSPRLYVRDVNHSASVTERRSACPRPVASQRRTQTIGRFDFDAQFDSAECQVRIDALMKLIDSQDAGSLPAVIEELADSDEAVRRFALEKAEATGLLLPPELLTDMAGRDSSASVRMLALHAIAEHPMIDEREKIVHAQYAIDDPSPLLQMTGGEILAGIEDSALLQDEDQRIRDAAAETIREEFP